VTVSTSWPTLVAGSRRAIRRTDSRFGGRTRSFGELGEPTELTGRPRWENAVHDLSAVLDHRPLLLAVDGFGDHGGAMADEPGDIRRGRGE
jgi:hypothetical protein